LLKAILPEEVGVNTLFNALFPYLFWGFAGSFLLKLPAKRLNFLVAILLDYAYWARKMAIGLMCEDEIPEKVLKIVKKGPFACFRA